MLCFLNCRSALGRVVCCRSKVRCAPPESLEGQSVMTAFLRGVLGRWLRFAGVVEPASHTESGDLAVFAELARVPSGVPGGRVEAVTSCERLWGDGRGSPGLSSCNQSTEKVTGRQSVVGKLFQLESSWCRCGDFFLCVFQSDGFGSLRSSSW